MRRVSVGREWGKMVIYGELMVIYGIKWNYTVYLGCFKFLANSYQKFIYGIVWRYMVLNGISMVLLDIFMVLYGVISMK